MFYHYRDTDYHFAKATFNSTNNKMQDNYHETMAGPDCFYCALARVDEAIETIWHVVGNSDIVYYQHNLTDFSIIGSKYASGANTTG